MKSKSTLFFVAIIFSHQLIAQTLSPIVISSSGGFSANGTAMLSSTVGEMAMVETFNTAGIILTQGFQQPEDFGVSVKDMDPVSSGITIGPNPTHGEIQLVFSSPAALKLNISIFDITGKIIYRSETQKQMNNNYVRLNLASIASGDYIFECRTSGQASDPEASFSQKITIIK